MAIVETRLKGELSLEYACIFDILSELDLNIKIFIDMYSDNGMLVDNNIDYLNKLDADLVIIPLSSHPSELVAAESWWKNTEQLNKPLLVLTSYAVDNSKCIYCPIWPILYPSKYVTIDYPTEQQCVNSCRNYMYSCLNNRFTIDRALNLIVWEKYHGVFDKHYLVTMNYSPSDIHTNNEAKQQLDLVEQLLATKPVEYKNIFDNLFGQLPIKNKAAEFYLDPFELMNAAFLDSKLNVVTEHWHFTQTPFISEKSLKPILAGQFFVSTGSVGTIEAVRDLGFDTFDDIIDHSVYTSETDLLEKMEKIHKYLHSVKNWPWESIYRSTEKRRLKNRDLLLSGNIQKKFKEQLYNKIYDILR